MAELLRGAPVAAALDKETSDIIASLSVRPCLAILRVGERSDDLSYEKSAIKRAAAVGIETKSAALPADVNQERLLAAVKELNEDDSVHGILLFRPLPASLDENLICAAIAPEKDVDGITSSSMAYVYSGEGTGFAPCTAQSVIEILDYYGVDIKGRDVTVIGRSLVIGRPVSMMLMRRDATVTICHTKTEDAAEKARGADIVVACAGRPEIVGPDYLSEGQVVIDVGMNYSESKGRFVGDVDIEQAGFVRAITPVPGGVGSVTTSVLMRHTALAAKNAAAVMK